MYKKLLIFTKVIIFLTLLQACNSDDNDYSIFIDILNEQITLDFNEPFDFMNGVSATDKDNNDLTSQIKINKNDFNNNKPGLYKIDYYIEKNNEILISKPIFVTVNERTKYIEGYTHVRTYYGVIDDEKEPPEQANYFPGDWSRKVESSRDSWLGIEGIITLPYFKGDNERFGKLPMGYQSFYDNPSIYFGANSMEESDIGLTWEIGALPNGELSKEKFAFRPFWRYIYNGVNTWENADNNNPYNFYFPGDVLRISVFSPRAHRLQFKIEVLDITKDPKFIQLRKDYGVYYPDDFLSPEIPSVGHGVFDARFMRVNAIDQYYNEGMTTKPTKAIVENAIWHEVYLYRNINNDIYKVPFIKKRYISANAPYDEAFLISYIDNIKDKGGEVISIFPYKANSRYNY